jgi:hypothetical protein
VAGGGLNEHQALAAGEGASAEGCQATAYASSRLKRTTFGGQ